MGEEEPVLTCYGPGSIAAAIIGTLLITLALAAAALLIYNIYWRSRKGKHLVLVSDVENPDDHYAFDNPNFREATPIKQNLPEDAKSARLDLSWLGHWSPLQAFSTPRTDKQRSLDDSFVTDSQLKTVSLKSHDFTGLGFSVCGNMRDGIFVKDLLHRGPAFESGCISPGDRIDSICISFRHMVFEDALTILSYASPYEVQVQVERNITSRPSTLLRKRDNSATNVGERILHPFYRSQSIADLATIDKTSGSGRKSNERKSTKPQDTSNANDCATLKISSSSTSEAKRENVQLERRGVDSVDAGDPPRHAKFGVRVLPMVGIIPKVPKDHIENEHNISIEQNSSQNASKEDEVKDVKTIITKGFQNLKEKINQNTLGRKKRNDEPREEHDVGEIAPNPKSTVEDVAISISVDVPEEVQLAGTFAQNNRKSYSAESLAARRPASEIIVDVSDYETPQKKPKGKAPAPPQTPKFEQIITQESNEQIKPSISKIFERQSPVAAADSDSEAEGTEVSSTQVTVHHNSPPQEPETDRKTASLGDLSRLDDHGYAGTLERAVSLDMDGSLNRKSKSSQPSTEDFPFEDDAYRKDSGLDCYNSFQRLKKSSDFGRLEDALNNSDSSLEKREMSETDLSSVAAHKIQEFSSWLEEVRKPQDEQTHHHVTLNVNNVSRIEQEVNDRFDENNESRLASGTGTPEDALLELETAKRSSPVPNSHYSKFDIVSESIHEIPLVSHYRECISHEGSISSLEIPIGPEAQPKDNLPSGVQIMPRFDVGVSCSTPENMQTHDSREYNVQAENPTFSFSVNGFNLQEPTRTVLLISQPNSLELEEIPTSADENPPQLPTSPPPSTSLTYITEIHVATPESDLETPYPTLKAKPQRKDLSPETSRIPVRTMKSETGQKVLAAIQSLAAKEMGKKANEVSERIERQIGASEGTVPSVAGYYLKKVPPAIPPRRNDESHNVWTGGKDKVNGTPRHVPMPVGVNLPVKTSATKIIFESQDNTEEF